MKKFIAENNIKFYTVNAAKIAQEIGLRIDGLIHDNAICILQVS